MSTKDEDILCQVCTRNCASFNYKGIVCDNCRVFFFRKITLKRIYNCTHGGNCKISPRVRTNCSACRWKKCLDAGMDPEDVGRRYDKRQVVPTFTKKYIKSSIYNFHEPVAAFGCRILPIVGKSQNVFEFVQIMLDFERRIYNYSGNSPQFAKASMNVSFRDVIANPTLCCERDTAAFSEVGSLSNMSAIPFWKIFCRVLTSYLDFTSGIEEIVQLDMLDRIKLCQYNVMDFVKYNLCFLQFDSKKRGIPLARTPKFILENAPDDFWGSYPSSYFRCHMQIVNIFEELVISKEEFILLIVIGLLNTPNSLSGKGHVIILRARERYSILLADFIRQTYKELSRKEVLDRVRKVLSIFPLVKECSRVSNEKQREMVLKSYGNMNSILGYEIHIKEF